MYFSSFMLTAAAACVSINVNNRSGDEAETVVFQ